MKHNQQIVSYPLSSMQQGMLFNNQFAPGSGVDIEQIICSLHEDVNVPALKKAWEQVLKRHPILRTSFRWQGLKEPLQDVHYEVDLPFEVQDWQIISVEKQENHLKAYLQSDRLQGFELTNAPLMRIALFRLDSNKYQLIWTFHHILLDGRSQYIILNEVFAYYEAFQKNQDLQLSQPRPYGDFIGWLQNQDLSEAEIFWRKLLKGFTAPTPFVVTKPDWKRNGDVEKYDVMVMRLSKETTEALKSFADRHQITPNTIIQGAWGLLLSHYSGEKDVVFGATRACRKSTIEGADSMVGLFINTLPMRVSVSPDKKLVPWLKELRNQQIAVREFEHTPLIKVQRWSDVPGGIPLFESILIFENFLPNSRLQSQGGNWENREIRILEQTNYPLTLYGYLDYELLLKLQYSRNRFDKTTINRMFGHLKTLLNETISNPQKKLSQLSLLTQEERNTLLVDWNSTKIDYPNTKHIQQLFEQRVEHMSESVAIVFEDKQLRYRELNKRANQLAHKLISLGVGPDVLVGIFMDRSLEMMVGLLGILKAGGAYVPLDPGYPKARIAFMIEDAKVPVLLTQPHLLGSLPDHAAHVVSLDSQWQAIDQEKDHNPDTTVNAENLAYTIYTSGSTGQPKGVMVSHRNVVNFFTGMDQHIGHEPSGVWLAVTSISFDISVLELVWTLTRGFKVVLFDLASITSRLKLNNTREPRYPSLVSVSGKDGALPALINRYRITHLQCTPSMAQMIILVPEYLESLRSLKKLMLGGEALPPSLVDQMKTIVSGEIYNMYGPTETTIWSTVHRVDKDDNSVSIGRPIANTELYILDRNLNPVPIGVPGELFIGGHGVVRGYLNRPELTEERFIPNPFKYKPNGTLYRTGDRVQYMEDGRIEFLGRLDRQVKIRGYRIELGEIEIALEQLPAVQKALVIVREDKPDDKLLVAYLTKQSESTHSVSELRSLLKKTLPDFMVPSSFVFLKTLPLTPNGKINHRCLPNPELVGLELRKDYAPPQTSTEKKLAKLLSEFLNIEKVGIHDNFFELGGNSLLAVQITTKICQTFNVELPLQTLFSVKTLANLANNIEDKLFNRQSSMKVEQ